MRAVVDREFGEDVPGVETARAGGAAPASMAPAGPVRRPPARRRAGARRSRGEDGGPGEPVPAILLGGEANALSVARDLGRMGVPVYAVGGPRSVVRYSRYCRWIDVGSDAGELDGEPWARFLLSDAAERLHGAVVLACSDGALQALIRHGRALRERYLLDVCNPAAQAALLDKLSTYQLGVAAGVPTPRFWKVGSRADAEALRGELVFPLMVKPRLSHVFVRAFGRKFVIVDGFDALLATLAAAAAAECDVLLMEHIPGGDEQLCSYYTYVDAGGRFRFDYTKRVVRRFPVGMGGGCHHVTDWIPELVEPSRRLFATAGVLGLANVEYKRDPRDGQYKLIECNARFTASNSLISASGFNISRFVYNEIAGRAQAPMGPYALGLRLWDPFRDLAAFLQLRAAGEITFGQWLKSVCHRPTLPLFSWRDPVPSLVALSRPVRKRFKRKRRSRVTPAGGVAAETAPAVDADAVELAGVKP